MLERGDDDADRGTQRVRPEMGSPRGVTAGPAIPEPAANRRARDAGGVEALRPYVARLIVDWLADEPGTRWRELEGSLVFADISGFTQLTERLARRGNVGAEEMSAILDQTFGQVLRIAYDLGGDVLKWGGDAVLILYSGDEHAERASAAAVSMQRTMASAGRLRTPSGPVTLRMSIGVHSGVFHCFLVGDLHRELVVTGPGASATVIAETTAQAGEIALSPQAAERVPADLLGETRGSNVMLIGAPDVTPGMTAAAAAEAPMRVDPRQALPVAIRDFLVDTGREAEHRLVTAGFIEFRGTDDVLARGGPAALCEVLDDLLAHAQRAARDHEVTFLLTDIASDGGKILVVGGIPTSAGNDEERVLRVVRSVLGHGGPLSLRAGVVAGHVFAGDFGPPYWRTYTVTGDAVNLAARLMANAMPGQLLATDDVVARSRSPFTTERLEPFRVKGKEQPVRAVAVGAPAATRNGSETSSRLIGRERELSTLLAALDAARRSQGSVVELLGEPGLGKSRLIEELGTRRDDVRTVVVTCDEYERTTPYFPMRTLVRRALGIPDDVDAQARGRLLVERMAALALDVGTSLPHIARLVDADIQPAPVPEQLDERALKERVEAVAVELLRVALPRPAVLVFEDVHWMDEASSDLLARFADGIEGRPCLLIITRRDDSAGFRPSGGATTIRLEPLPPADVAALVLTATESTPLPQHRVEELAARSGGNPMFLGQLLAAGAADADDELPDSIQGALAARIDRLAPADRLVLRYASVLGMRFELDLLHRSLEGRLDALDEEVWARLSHFLVRDDGHAGFRHALIRDAAYAGLPYRRRRALHETVGRTIEQAAGGQPGELAEILSFHFFHAQRHDEAWRYSALAADRARSLYANVEAARLLERAVVASRHLRGLPAAQVARVHEERGDVLVRLGEFDQAAVEYRSARRRMGSHASEAARLVLKQALIPWRQGRYADALRWLGRGIRLLAGREDTAAGAQRARLLAWYAVVRQKQGRSLEAIEWCHRAVEEAERSGARDALAHAYYVLDWAYGSLGRLDEAVYGRRALAIYEELGDLERQAAVLNNLGTAAHFQGRWDEALALYERAREKWEKVGDRWSASFPEANRALILLDQGRLEDAEPILRDALRVARASHTASRMADAATDLARLACRAGRFAEGAALLAEARTEYERRGEPTEVLATDARLAECYVLEGKAEQALSIVSAAAARAAHLEAAYPLVPMLHRIHGSALAQAGRVDEARAELTRAAEEARAHKAEYELAATLDALAEVARRSGEPADARARERDAILQRLGVIALPAIPMSSTPERRPD